MPVAIGIALVFAIAAAWRLGINAGNALWLWAILGGLGVIVAALWAWHRRELGRIHELYAVEVGRYRRDGWARSWPKWCQDCGAAFNGWAALRAHDDTETSPCARYLEHRERTEPAPATLPNEQWQADILGPRPGENIPQGAGSIERG
jgi:hypothetical protein